MTFRDTVSQTNGSYHFPDLQYSSKEFYDKLTALIKEYEFPDVTVKVVNYAEGGLFSSRREYLSICRNGHQYDVCAAPFGKSFFISWWLTESKSALPGVLAKIPVFGNAMARQAETKTFFQIDTQAIFKSSMDATLKLAIEQVCENKGLRIPEDERELPVIA